MTQEEDSTADDSVEKAWQDEIERRLEDLDSGRAMTVSWEELQRRISAKLKNRR